MKRHLLLLSTIIFIWANSGIYAEGATITWSLTGTPSGSWHTASNWSPGQVPVSGDDVHIPGNTAKAIYSSGTTNLNSLTCEGSTQLEITGGTLNLSSNSSADTNSTITFSGGYFGNSGTLSISGTFSWSGGKLTGTGNITFQGGSVFNIVNGSNYRYLDKVTINNSATTTYNASGSYTSIYVDNGAVFNNQAGAIFDIQSDSTVFDYSSGTVGSFNNSGTLKKSGGTSTTIIDIPITNNNIIELQAGDLSFSRGGTYSGSFNVASGRKISFDGETHNLNDGVSINGNGTVRMTTGTVNINASSMSVASTATFAMSNGTLSGSGTFSIEGTFDWSGGTIGGDGSVSIASGGKLTIPTGGYYKYLNTRTINNYGTVTYSATSSYSTIYVDNGAVFNNQAGAIFDIQSDSTVFDFSSGTVGTFNNYGTLKKSVGTATSTIDIPITNTNIIELQAGDFSFSRGGTYSGSFNVASGRILSFDGETHNLNEGVSINGNGTVRMTSGTVNINAASISVASTATFAMSNGTLSGSGRLSIEGTFDWSGGTIGGDGSVSISSVGKLTIPTGGYYKYLNTRTINNYGTVTYSATSSYSSIYFDNGAVFNNQAGAIFDIQSDSTVFDYSSGTVGTFNNSGTLKKSAGTSTTTIDIPITNNNIIELQSGDLSFSRGGTYSGSFNVASGRKISFDGETHNLNEGVSINGNGMVKITTGTVNVNAASISVASTATFAMSNGTLSGSGTLSIEGTFDWSGGTIGGGGSVLIASSGKLTIPTGGYYKYLNTRTINNYGTVTYSASSSYSSIYFDNGAVFNNQAGAIFDIQSDSTVFDYSSGTIGTFNNSGTLKKSAGTSTTTIGIPITNNNVIELQSGDLSFSRGGTYSGSFNVASGRKISFDGETHNLNNGVSINGNGRLQLTTGTVNINASTLSVPSGVTFAVSNGTLAGSGNLSVTGSFDWSAGTLSGDGSVTIETAGTLTIPGGGYYKYLNTRTINNYGTVVYSASGSYSSIYMQNGAFFNNKSGASFDIQSDSTVFDYSSGTESTFNNSGTLKKSSGTGVSSLNITFNNNQVVESQSGILAFIRGGTSSGSYSAASSATVRFGGGTHNLSSASSVSGAGTINFTSGTVVIGGGYSVSGKTHIAGGTAQFDVTSDTKDLTLESGTLNGSGTLSVSGAFIWNAGTLGGTGTTNIQSSATLTIPGGGYYKYIDTRAINNYGTVVYSASSSYSSIYMQNGAVFNNKSGSIFDIQSDSTVFEQNSGAESIFNNSGTFKKSSGTGISSVNINFNNNQAVDSQSGILAFNRGGTSSGSYAALSSATVRFGGGTHNLSSASSVSGAGTINFTSGTVAIGGSYSVSGKTHIAGGTAQIDVTSDTKDLTLESGTLNGSGTLSVSGAFIWNAGTLGGSGTTNIQSSATLTIPGGGYYKYIDTRAINNYGTVVYSASSSYSNIYMQNGAVFNNKSGASFDLQSDSTVFEQNSGAESIFNNYGTFKKSAGTGISTININFNNNQTVDSQSGILAFNRGGTSSGSYAAVSSATVRFGGGTHNLSSASSLSGAGIINFTSGTVAIGGSYSVSGKTHVSGGTAQIDVTSDTKDLTLESGTLNGSGTLSVSGAFIWNAGTLGGSGTTNIQSSATLTIPTGGYYKYLDTRTVNNAGSVVYSAAGSYSNIYVSNGAVFNNQSGANFDIQSDSTVFYHNSGNNSSINNSGTILKSYGTGNSNIGMAVTNFGVIDVQAGTLKFDRDKLDNRVGCILRGKGTLDISSITFTNNGSTNPGTSDAGILSVTGNFSQTSNGNTNIEIGGIEAGTAYDRLDISNQATLAGTLNVSLINSYQPKDGDIFQIINFSSRNGKFETANLPALSGNLFWDLTYGTDNVKLAVRGNEVVFNEDRTIENGDTTFDNRNITVGDGTNPATVTINGKHAFNSLTVKNNGTLTHTPTDLSSINGIDITVSGDLLVEFGGSIEANGKGFLGGYQGSNNSESGRTSGNSINNASSGAAGGSYAGWGGNGSNGVIGQFYGDLVNPVEPGAGGGAYNNSHPGGNGGGLIRMTVSGTLTNNGYISADGASLGNVLGGGGAGGGIYINSGTLSGNGTISANGGSGGTYGYGYYEGGGGGGRIAIYYASNQYSGNIVTYGGDKGNDGGNGGAGSVYLKDGSQTYGDLQIKNNLSTDDISSPKPFDIYRGTSDTTGGISQTVLTDSTASWKTDDFKGLELNPNTNQMKKKTTPKDAA